MEFLDKAKLQIRDAKRDKKIFLYTVIILIPCLIVTVFAFVSAYIPVDFTISNDNKVSVFKIGYFFSYETHGIQARPDTFDFGWFNVLMICCCVGVGIFMILVVYLNFFQAKKTIMNRYAYIICACMVLAIILQNVFGQLAGKYLPDEEPTGTNFFPIFFGAVQTDTNAFSYRWNEAGVIMLVLNCLVYFVMIVMIPFWIVVGVKTGRINRNTGKVMMMKDDHMQSLIAEQAKL